MRGVLFSIFAGLLAAGTPQWDRAHELYQRTECQQALYVLVPLASKDADTLELIGQSYFMLGEYKKATETFERAIVIEPQAPGKSAELYHWLGRTFGRRAETGSILTAPGNASKARQMFERAVQLDPANQEAISDLFDYYLEAPGFLGGGMQKAEDLARHMATLDDAEGHYAQAQIKERRKEYEAAEDHLRRAAELAPAQVGRILDLAKYLATHERFAESDSMFQRAARIAPGSPKVLFARAEAYVRQNRNLGEARALLQQYLKSNLTPDDPPRHRAEDLLRKLAQ